ncbi:KTR2 [[Candida] subhashii]|uniref:KTR2 n=1 Tax=[Candida] subhashii TaxID=561895 RepID=A0A8J5QII7_9ASCO|nr:KTR2 [[Candida] subhashii]KAG7661875.1 KTR2 [[Candida] subhashii]
MLRGLRNLLFIGVLIGVYYNLAFSYLDRTIDNYSSYLQQFNHEITDTIYNPLKRGLPKLPSNTYLDPEFAKNNQRQQIGKENATLVMLVRNMELEGALKSMRSLEDRFNREYKYPWVFLNDVPFDEDFIMKTSLMASGKTYYELIPESDWQPPSFINETKLQENLDKSRTKVIYGGYRSYRNMCHFNSGFFYKQKRLLNYEWYFRVEPDVEYMCDFQYDPFELLRINNKIYGFIVTFHEYENTIPTLWQTVEGFMKEHPDLLHPNNALKFITTNETSLNHFVDLVPSSTDYNLCHFWSNFEIGNLNFFRSEAYAKYFDYLDKAGGFYYERWGDAPVHSIALALLADKDQIHHFEDIGYFHAPYLSCPSSEMIRASKRCICEPRVEKKINKTIDVNVYSCLARWWKYGSGKTFLNDVDYTR